MKTNVAGILCRRIRKLALNGSRTTALGIVHRVDSAGFQRLGVRASLVATRVAVDELHIGIFVTGHLHVFNGCLLAWDTAAARD